jgi:hypothetical protein
VPPTTRQTRLPRRQETAQNWHRSSGDEPLAEEQLILNGPRQTRSPTLHSHDIDSEPDKQCACDQEQPVHACSLTLELSRLRRRGALADGSNMVLSSWRPGGLAGADRLERRIRPHLRLPSVGRPPGLMLSHLDFALDQVDSGFLKITAFVSAAWTLPRLRACSAP